MVRNALVLSSAIGLVVSLAIFGYRQDLCFGESRQTGQPSSAAEPPVVSVTPPDLSQTLEKELGLAATPEEKDPLILVLELMKESERRLGRKDTGPQTQQIQKKILNVFDSLMSQAMQTAQQQPSQGASQDASQQAENQSSEASQAQSAQDPRNTSSASGTPGLTTENIQFTQVLERIWGELPERERAAVLQRAAEAIVPRYRALIETYYRELSRGRESSP